MNKSYHLPSLIDFWRLKRKHQGEPCIIRDCHRIKAQALTDLVLGRLPKQNLMILEPPRIGKTDLGAKAFISWGLSYFPDSEYIVTSYGQDRATEISVDVRNTLTSEWYRNMVDEEWGAIVDVRGQSASGRQDEFYTAQGGIVKAVGRGGGITGFGAGKLRPEWGGCIVIDDPLKAQEEKSPTERQNAIDYVQKTLKSRRNRLRFPETPIVLIMQRLHPKDPAGFLLQEERDKWHVVQIPARNEHNESIWPDRISIEYLNDLEQLDPDTYWSQYMQNPSQIATVLLKKAWWYHWRDLLEIEKRITFKFITGDTAFKEKDSNDWSVFQCWGAESTNGLHLLDQVRGRWEFPRLLQVARAFWHKHNTYQRGYTQATHFFIEDKASGISLIQSLNNQGGVPVIAWEPREETSPDKVGRCRQGSQPLQQGRLSLPPIDVVQDLTLRHVPLAVRKRFPDLFKDWQDLPGTRWVPGFLNECESMSTDDSHLFDDQVDTFTEAVSIWMENGGGKGCPLPDMSMFLKAA